MTYSFGFKDKKPLVNFKNVHLTYQLNSRKNISLRDKMINFINYPVESMTVKSECLHVLKNISFSAYQGDRIAIIGHNGAGKSSLCRLISKIYRPHLGQIELTGEVRAILDPSAVIYPDLTGRENAQILLSLLHSKISQIDFELLLNESLDFSGLRNFLDTPYRHYSHGMQARLCLSLATCCPADIIVLDEVFDGADHDFKIKISERVLNMINKSGVVFFVSHSEEQVRKICNKGLLIDQGKIILFGELDDVYNAYAKTKFGAIGHDY